MKYFASLTLATCAAASCLPSGVKAPTSVGLSDSVAHVSAGGSAVCVSGTVKVQATSTKNIKWNFDIPANQSEATQALVSQWSPGANFLKSILGGYQKVGGTYNIGATICAPKTSPTSKKLKWQVLTHGIGYDRRYWDLTSDYSYVDVAAEAGYATLFYDRLGVGESSHEDLDPINTIQSPLEVEVLESLITLLRKGSLGIKDFTVAEVVGVGHSFGSALTQALTAIHPTSLNAAVLTGFSVNASGMAAFSLGQNAQIASLSVPQRFANFSNGYLTVSSGVGNQVAFLHSPGVAPDMQALADYVKNTVTFGEFFTAGLGVGPASNFTGPVAFAAGKRRFGLLLRQLQLSHQYFSRVCNRALPKS